MLHKKIILGLCLLLSSIAAAVEPLVRIDSTQVTYRGISQNAIEHFQNIKYGHDTSGQRRFAPPEAYNPPQGTEQDATKPGVSCPQLQNPLPPAFSKVDAISEDCLSLRIARPAGTKTGAKLPVVIWIHGGGVIRGTAYDDHFDPEKLLERSVELGKPIIYVAINYRLSIFGFARLPLLKEEKSLNVGMRDQRMAMQWVQDNIEAFGGDPSKITAYGLSAGGTFLSLHHVAFAGEKGAPFTQAWMISGPPGTALNMSSDVVTDHTRAVAANVECATEEDGDALKCLRAVSVEKLLEAAMEYSAIHHPPLGLFTFIPSIDDDLLPARQTDLYRSGKYVKGIKMVLGWAQDDGDTNSGPASASHDEEAIISNIRSFAHALDDEDFATLYRHYKLEDFTEDVARYETANPEDTAPKVHESWFRLSRVMRDLLFTCSSIDFGFYNAKYSREANSAFDSVRLYTFNQSVFTPLFKAGGMPYARTTHGSDQTYIFNGIYPEGELLEHDQKLSRQLSEAFISFAYTGKPEAEGFEDWPTAFDMRDMGNNVEEPQSLSIQVIGGPYGSGPAQLHVSDEEVAHAGEAEGQQVLEDGFVMGAMNSKIAAERKRELQRENLFERCRFINGLHQKLY